MSDLPPVRRLLKQAPATTFDLVVLTYDDRLLRRKRLVTVHEEGFLVDLPEVTNLDDFWGFELADGRAIQVVAAEEPVLAITGDLPRLAWHIGNRHTPCQIEAARLLIREDHVIEAMLRQLGAGIARVTEPFQPEGGAYGHGRTMGHDHGAGEGQSHSQSHSHSQSQSHSHSHAHSHGDGHSHSHSHSHSHDHHHHDHPHDPA